MPAREPPLATPPHTASRLKGRGGSATVPRMSSPRTRQLARARARSQRRKRAHAGRVLLASGCAIALLLVLLLTAFGSGSTTAATARPVAATTALVPGRLQPEVIASVGTLHLQLPIPQSALTAIGYHRGGEGSLDLEPLGRQGNEGLLARLWRRIAGSESSKVVWYQLGGEAGPGTSAVDVGAPPGTDVYAPVDGSVVGIVDYVLANRVYGSRIDIRPADAPSLIVSLTQLKPDPALTVGSPVAASTSKLGTVLDLSPVQDQALARFTQDAGNNVSVEVRPAATLGAP